MDDAILALRARELPLLERVAFLDHATVGVVPRRHVEAASEVVRRHVEHGPVPGEGGRLLEGARTAAARLLHGDPREVALLRSTSEAVGLVARGLEWREGDEVVLHERDFVGCLAPFLALRERGVRIVWLRGTGVDVDEVASVLTSRTRAVCLSLVSRSTGWRAPVASIGQLCRDRGIWLAVDAAQAMGVLDLDAPALGADVVGAHAYKFLCSGFGLAPTWCSERARAELDPPLLGWKNADRDGEALDVGPAGEARRFEPTLPALPLLAGLEASLGLLLELGPAESESRAVALADRAAEGLAERGYGLVSPEPGSDHRSSLAVARHPTLDATDVVERLAHEDVAVGAVEGAVRVACHGFNTGDDVERLLASLPGA